VSNSSHLNLCTLGCIWPTEPNFADVQETLNFQSRFTCLDDPFNIWVRDPAKSSALREQEAELERIAKINMTTKNSIDNFRRIHQKKLLTLKD
jgi:hypothetical protein